MKFREVEPAMRAGKKIKLDTWKKAYWYFDPKTGYIMNHFEDGGEDVPTIALVPRDLVWVATGDWQIVEDNDQTPADTSEVKDTYSFGEAIDFLKAGKKVARRGWNGKGMFLVFCPGNEVPTDRMRVKAVKDFYEVNGKSVVTINPHIDMKAADGSYVTGWLASQTDMLAEDWIVIE